MIYVMSDIHAQYDLFRRLLDRVKFSDGDVLISCGDIIDKGKDSARLLKFIRSMPNARCINGNHEYMFLKYYWGLMRESPDNFDYVLKKLQDYFPDDGKLLDWDTMDWVESLPFYIEEKEFLCVHAGIPLDDNNRIIPPDNATREQLVYDRNFKDPQVEVRDSKCFLFGHTPTSYLLPDGSGRIIAYRRKEAQKDSFKITDFYKIHLDTGVWLNGVLGCICIENCNTYYVKKQ